MRAIMVCVDYCDLLEITLPLNLHHFSEVMIVTSPEDVSTQSFCKHFNKVKCFVTNSFYEHGAIFNKWFALEEGLDEFNRQGWLCIMDADVVWPNKLPELNLQRGKLYTPVRRMMNKISLPLPEEEDWKHFPLHRNLAEFAGYSQIFHAQDPALGESPWHQVDWEHAGGADSFFQRKWQKSNKIRPPFEVLHLGEAGKNWYGRATPFLDGTISSKSEERTQAVNNIWKNRRKKKDPNFTNEKVKLEP